MAFVCGETSIYAFKLCPAPQDKPVSSPTIWRLVQHENSWLRNLFPSKPCSMLSGGIHSSAQGHRLTTEGSSLLASKSLMGRALSFPICLPSFFCWLACPISNSHIFLIFFYGFAPQRWYYREGEAMLATQTIDEGVIRLQVRNLLFKQQCPDFLRWSCSEN